VEVSPAEGGQPFDSVGRRVGLRSVELVNRPDKAGRSFFLKVNGRAVFCKGANWIPADIFPTRVTAATYRNLLESAVRADMNMLRIWGGGIYEADVFYDLCDELGIMLWHDHMFACSAYPADGAFLASVEAEIRDNLRRLSCHPSIALWCGNNENEQGLAEGWLPAADQAAGRRLRREYLRLTAREERVTRREAPDLPWWPSSPSTDGRIEEPNDHTSGDSHFWEVWHRRKPFSRYLEIRPRFNSEFGFQSFPDIETLRPVLGSDRSQWSLTSPVMEQHQRHGSGNAIITEMACSFFRIPQNLDDFFYVSQLLQGLAIKAGVEHWRRLAPECMGTLYWQLNDCWPVASWASIDGALRWKALHYFAKRFYSPLLASVLDNGGSRRVEAFVTSDLPEPVSGRWAAELWTWAGRRLWRRGGRFALKPLSTQEVASWPAEKLARGFDDRSKVFLRVTAEGRGASGHVLRSENWCPLRAYKRVELEAPKLRLAASGGPERFRLRLVSDVVAPFTEIRTGKVIGSFSDNFIDLLPGRAVTVEFRPSQPMTLAALRKVISVRTLRSTY
jgi:beta-mannosidase